MWDRAIEQLLILLRNDAQLKAMLGGIAHIYRNRSRPRIQIPEITYTVISNTLEENYAPCMVQWDVFASDMDLVSQIEQRLFQLMHSDLPVQVGTIRMWSQFQSGYDFANEDETIAHRAVEYRYTPARENEI